MIRVFNDGGYSCDPRINAANHGGLLFIVKNEADLRRLFAIEPLARNQEAKLRAIIGLECVADGLDEELHIKAIIESHEMLMASPSPAVAMELTDRITQAGNLVATPKRRAYLRELLRYWDDYIYGQTGTMPKHDLQPATVSGCV